MTPWGHPGAMPCPRRGTSPPVGASRIQGIVLAGTYHSAGSLFDRLRSRPLLPVAETPLICYALRWLNQGGVAGATICTNSASRAVRAFLEDGPPPPVALDYCEDWTPRGPAGCVRDAGLRSGADTLVITDGTIIPTVDLKELLAAHERSGAAITVVVHHGVGGNGFLSPAGIYVFERRVLDVISERGFQDIKENVLPRLRIAREPVVVYADRADSPRVLSAESYLAANQWVLGRVSQWEGLLQDYPARGESLVHPTAHVDPTAMLIGPVVLGPGVAVEREAAVVGPATIGAGTIVGAGAMVSRSVVWDGCTIGRGATVDRSLLADGVVVKPKAPVFCEVKAGHRRLGTVVRRLGERVFHVEPRPASAASLPLSSRINSA